MNELDYIVAGGCAYFAGFEGDVDDLVRSIDTNLVKSLEILGVKKLVWGSEGQDWEYLEDLPNINQG